MKNNIVKNALKMTGMAILAAGAAFAQPTPPQPPTVNEVVVTGSKIELPSDMTAQSITVITRDDINRSGSKTLKEVIEKTTGVAFTDYGGRSGGKTISIRASSSEQVLVLLDGRRIADARMGVFDLANIPLETVERVEIVRGTASAVYGADAMAGVVNIITKNPAPGKITTVDTASGSFGTQLYSATLYQKFTSLMFIANTGKEQSDGFRENSWLDSENFMFKVALPPTDWSTLTIYADKLSKKSGSPGVLPQDPNAPYGSTTEFVDDLNAASSPDNWSSEEKNRAAAEFNFETDSIVAGTPLDFTIRSYYNDYKYVYWEDPSDPFSWGVGTLYRYLDREWGNEVLCTAKLANGSRFAAGSETVKDELESEYLGNHSAQRTSFYTQYIMEVTQGSTLTLGGRLDDHSVYGSEFSPSIGFTQKALDNARLRFSAGKGYRAPNLSDLYFPNLGWGAGNEKLKPEVMTEYEFGVTGAGFTINVFYRDAKDFILWSETSPWFYQPVNLAGATVRGMEFQTSQKLSEGVNADLNYTFTEPRDSDTGEHLLYKPKHTANLLMTANLPYETKACLDIRWVDNYVPVSEKDNCWSDYIVTTSRITRGFSMFGGKGEVYLGVDNLLDEEYMVKKGYPMPERNLLFGLKVEF